jgi:cytochrome P450
MKDINFPPEQCLHGMLGMPLNLLVNNRSIALDEKEYDEPLRYNPDRFLDKDLNNALLGHWGFGPGRRVCVGWNVGQQNMWIATARLLYCFDFEQDPVLSLIMELTE